MHVHLFVEEHRGKPVFEPVHVSHIAGRRYRIDFTRGLTYCIAAGDEIDLADDGGFTVASRGGNLAVRVFSDASLVQLQTSLTATVESTLKGRLDGSVEHGLAYTVPVHAGFKAVERVFTKFASANAGSTWEFGNVYADDGTPLRWWESVA